MAPKTRAELNSEIRKLQKQQLKAISDATFGGWTTEEESAYLQRSNRLGVLILELEALDPK